MAHELALMADGRYAMAFVGETPWHNHGQSLAIDATIEEWIAAAGFNWQALAAPVTYTDANGIAHNFEDKKILFRSDNGAPLSVVGEGFQIVQPADVMEVMRQVTEREGWHLHTAGILRDGRRLWAMATRGRSASIVSGDKVTENILIATGLDGTLATHAGHTAIRVVCANTLGQAIGKGLKGKAGKGEGVRVSHRSEFDPAVILDALGHASQAFDSQVEMMRNLAERPCDLEEAREILRGIFGQPVAKRGPKTADAATITAEALAKAAAVPASPLGADDFAALLARPAQLIDPDEGRDFERLIAKNGAREQKSVCRVLELFSGEGKGADMAGVKGTRWGLLNAITEHIDHEQGRDASRLEAAWFGRGADFKAQAVEALIAA